jgi:hypothetical protein
VNLWCEALGVQKIGMQDNFFDLDGESLAAALLLVNVAEIFDKIFRLADSRGRLRLPCLQVA